MSLNTHTESGVLITSVGHVSGLISLVNSLHPKPAQSVGGSGAVVRRRREILGELLKHALVA
jgi:hypothetical protein